jgi:hypothetical protein
MLSSLETDAFQSAGIAALIEGGAGLPQLEILFAREAIAAGGRHPTARADPFAESESLCHAVLAGASNSYNTILRRVLETR